MSEPTAMTVLGAVPTSEIGVTLMHEHVLNDCSCCWRGNEPDYSSAIMHSKVDASMQQQLIEDPFGCLDNCINDDEALAIQESLVDHPDRLGRLAEGYTHEEIGECLLLLGREEEAAPHFAIAFSRLRDDPWLKASEPDRLSRIQHLSR